MKLLNPHVWLALCVTLGLYNLVTSFTCDDGCDIPDGYVDDGYCDCSNCEEETQFTCSNCECPTDCGDYFDCLTLTQYICSDGCNVSIDWVNDGYCDCSDCGDENSWTCDTCDCPDTCGDFYDCGTGSGTGSTFTTDDLFTCNDGCEIYTGFENDGWCDCSECEDENSWTCETCSCPTECGDYEECSGDYGWCNTNGMFNCSDGCEIDCELVNDDYCDCHDCGDEITTGYNCDNCGCRDEYDCENFVYCGSDSSETDGGSGGSSSGSASTFDQTTDAGRAALAFLIVGIMVLIIVILVCTRSYGNKNENEKDSTDTKEKGIIDLDSFDDFGFVAGMDDDDDDDGDGATGVTGGKNGKKKDQLAQSQKEEKPAREKAPAEENTSGNPQNTNSDNIKGEVPVQQGVGGGVENN